MRDEDMAAHDTGQRPWGHFEILVDESGLKIKRIIVRQGHRLSLQRHQRRSEHWFVLAGAARVTLDGKHVELRKGQSQDIPAGSWHRVAALEGEDLVFIEIQTGEYFGEDDIERRQDDYGRADEKATGA